MCIFDFTRCVVEEEKVYCTDANGSIYVMSQPERIPVSDCPVGVVERFLATSSAIKRRAEE
jgi:hypothetical protein